MTSPREARETRRFVLPLSATAGVFCGAVLVTFDAKREATNEKSCRKRGRVVDCTGLENRQRATVREFESHRFRQISI